MFSKEEAVQLYNSPLQHTKFVHSMLVDPAHGLVKFFELLPMEDAIRTLAALIISPLENRTFSLEEWNSAVQALLTCKVGKRGPDPFAARAVRTLLQSLSSGNKSADDSASLLQQGVGSYILACDAHAQQHGKSIGLAFHTRDLKKNAAVSANKFVRGLFNDITDWYKQP